jgi:hypothetical protein
MAGLTIDRLTLSVPFFSEAQGRRLAAGIAERLSATGLAWARGEFPSLRIDLTANVDADPDRLAERVVAELVRQIGRA